MQTLQGLAAEVFDEIRKISSDGSGISRTAWSPVEKQVLEYLVELARKEGIRVDRDAANCNIIFSLEGSEPGLPIMLTGSHMDSVPSGGNYDGACGVIGGLLCLIKCKRENIVPRRSIQVFNWRNEEASCFNQACLGSHAAVGKLDCKALQLRNIFTDRTLEDHMQEDGVDTDKIARGEPLLDLNNIHAYVELHIEQGPVLEKRNLSVGVVDSIRGVNRYEVECHGEPGHSGATPRDLRHDAVLATAELLHRLEEKWIEFEGLGKDLVFTCGIFSTDPKKHAVSRIPGEAQFALEWRSAKQEILEEFNREVGYACKQIGLERGVSFKLGDLLTSETATMNKEWMEYLERIGKSMGFEAPIVSSGAGHDAATIAGACIPTSMIFIRSFHGSHNPDEKIYIEDFIDGCDVLFQALTQPLEGQ